MLNVFREGARTWGIKLLIWFVAITFVGSAFLVWGRGGSQRSDIVAVIDDDITISKHSLAERTRQVEDAFRRQVSGKVNFDFLKNLNAPKAALDALVDNALQIKAAKTAGMKISQMELQDTITGMPEFQTAGAFDMDRYVDILKRNGIRIKEFESDIKHDLLIRKLRATVERSVFVSEAEAASEYLYENQPVVVEYVEVNPETLKNKVKVDDARLKAWFDKHGAEFEIPESRSFQAIIIKPEALVDSVKLGEADLKTYYESAKPEFETEETVRASHILIQAPIGATDAEIESAKKKIDKALARVRGGEDFAKVAREVSEGPSASSGGDLGTFPKGRMTPEFEKVAFGLKEGEVSEPFKTEFGWHIVKVMSHSMGGAPPFEEVKERVAKKARKAKAWEMAGELARNMLKNLNPGKFGESANFSDGFELKKFTATKDRPIRGIREWRTISDTLFDMDKGAVSGVIELADEFVVAKLETVTPPRIPALDEISDKVKRRYVARTAYEMAKETATKIEEAVRDGKDLKTSAEGEGYHVSETKPYSLASMRHRGAGTAKVTIRQALDMKEGEIRSAPYGAGFAAFMVKRHMPVDPIKMKADLPKMRKQLLGKKRSNAYTQFVAGLRKHAEETGRIEILVNLGGDEANS